MVVFLGDGVHDVDALFHDFRTYSVAGEDGYVESHNLKNVKAHTPAKGKCRGNC